MSSTLKNLSAFSDDLPSADGMKIAIIVSEWNSEITSALLEGAKELLLKQGIDQRELFIHHVPGSFELPMAASWMIYRKKVDAVICLGCVIRGETSHYDHICDAVARGIMDLNLSTGVPVVFGLVTTENMKQAVDRAGGKHGNKGIEAAATAVRMVTLRKGL